MKGIVPRCLDALRSNAARDQKSKRYLEVLEPLWTALKPPRPFIADTPSRPDLSSSIQTDFGELDTTTTWTNGQGTAVTDDILAILGEMYGGVDHTEWQSLSWDWRFLITPFHYPPSQTFSNYSSSSVIAAHTSSTGSTSSTTNTSSPIEFQQPSCTFIDSHNRRGSDNLDLKRVKRSKSDEETARMNSREGSAGPAVPQLPQTRRFPHITKHAANMENLFPRRY
jgi:hypothetical protein